MFSKFFDEMCLVSPPEIWYFVADFIFLAKTVSASPHSLETENLGTL